MTLFREVESRTGKQREAVQSAARPARVRFYVLTRGTGEHRPDETLEFNAFFLEEPSFTWGAVAPEGASIPKGLVPICTAFVLAWDVTENGLYKGADMAYAVDGARRNEEVRFSLVFEGYALRTTSPFEDDV